MTKKEFLNELDNRLAGLPEDERKDRLAFYSEAIDDRVDEGKSEVEAVEDLGGIDGVVNDIAKDTSLVKLVAQKVKPKRSLKAWEIVLLVLGFPLWFPLTLTAFILMSVFYLLLWVFVIVAYAVEISLSIGSIGALVVFFLTIGSGSPNVIALGAAIMCAGGAVLFLFACYGATVGTLNLTKKIFTGIKKAIIRKGSK